MGFEKAGAPNTADTAQAKIRIRMKAPLLLEDAAPMRLRQEQT
jgi:hypothetical protein